MLSDRVCHFRHLLPAVMLMTCLGCQYTFDWTSSEALSRHLKFNPLEQTSDADNWPGFRGWNGSGVSSAENLPVHWSATTAVAWRTSIPGQGNSSPVVWDDSVLITTANANETGSELKLLCYRRDDGTLRWEASVGIGHGSTHSKNGFASPTVCTDGSRIYAFFGSAGLFCFNFNGQKLWQAELGPLEHVWGTASSPVLFGDLVIQLCDQQSGSFLVALDKFTGREVWRTKRDSYGCWSTPAFVQTQADGQPRVEIIVNGTGTNDAEGGRVTAYDPLTGMPLWYASGTTDIVCPAPLVGNDVIYSTSGRNGPTIAIRPGGSGDITATHVNWKRRHGAPYVPTGVLYHDRLYLVSDAGVLSCLTADEGEVLWQHRLGGRFWASLVAGDGKIYATDEAGTTHVVAASDEFQLLARNQLNEQTLATPAIAHGELIFRTATHLVCISATPPAAAPAPDEEDPDAISPSEEDLSVDPSTESHTHLPPRATPVRDLVRKLVPPKARARFQSR